MQARRSLAVQALSIPLALTLSLGITAQDPRWSEPWARAGGATEHPGAIVVTGTPELGRDEALLTAVARAESLEQQRLQESVELWFREHAPVWLPQFLVDRAARNTRHRLASRTPRVLAQDFLTRDFGYGPIHQTALLVEPARIAPDQLRRTADRQLDWELTLLGYKSLGILGFWGLLALCGVWLDRLTRGYMTWRLRAIGLLLGGTVPVVTLLL